ncbi:MAG: general secretion pathway protein GspK [Betaproteobacteria bacterium]|jgi:general secretion pathway protein K|nr:general secretion pathway protein GspK [Betaproteobacteria bacterium]
MTAMSPGRRSAHHGIALVAVLWMVAALSVMALGLVHVSRKEAQKVGVSVQSLKARAMGEAGIQLALQNIKARQVPVDRLIEAVWSYDGASLPVTIQPLNGLISLNNAPKELLISTLVIGAQVEKSTAEIMASTIVKQRSTLDARGVPIGFEALEELLNVPWVTYDVYAKLKPLLTSDVMGSGRVNPLAAKQDVLLVLAEGNAQLATQLSAKRDAGLVGIDFTGLTANFLESGPSQKIKLDAVVGLPDGSNLVVSRSVDLNPGIRGALPWRTFGVDQRLEVSAQMRR